MFELVVVIAVISVLATLVIPEFAGMVSVAKETAAYKEVRSSIPEYIALYGNSVDFACMYDYDESHGYYVFVFQNGYLKYAGDILPAENQKNQNYVGEGNQWYAFMPQKGFEYIKLCYTEVNNACGSSSYTGFYLDIEQPDGSFTGQCSFGDYKSGKVICLNSDVAVSKYISSGDESILLNDIIPTHPSPPIFNNGGSGGNDDTDLISNPGNSNGNGNGQTDEEAYSIKNIIYLIPDGAGWDMYDLANKVKADIIAGGKDGISGAATPSTINTITGINANRLYLDYFMAGTAKATLAVADNGSLLTDPAAGGTAVAGGKKTDKEKVSLDILLNPIPSIFEICAMSGKSTGLVTTGSWVDATPSGFLAHSDKPAKRNKFYQREISYQMLYSGIDILLASGTDNGTYTKNNGFLNSLHAKDLGYYIVNNFAQLEEAVNEGKTKVWSNFLEGVAVGKDPDDPSNHIKFDIHAHPDDDLTILKMTKAALTMLSEKINNDNGFFLTIEAAAIDFEGENYLVAEAVGEFLAFDETFAYCVEWAKKRNDTIIIAYPSHDAGGFSIKENIAVTYESLAFDNDKDGYLSREECLNYLSDSIIAGRKINMANYIEITDNRVADIPLCVYAPDWCYDGLLWEMDLPNGENTGTSGIVRTGLFNTGTVINDQYSIENSNITKAVLSLCGLMSTDYAREVLFVDATQYVKSINPSQCTITIKDKNKNEIEVLINSRVWFDQNGNQRYFDEGRCVFVPKDLDALYEQGNYYNKGTFYLPRSFLVELGLIEG